ncbi:MAG: site-specific integrase [Rikenellaceae bacterium]
MASVKVKIRLSKIEGKEGTIYYQIIQNKIVRQILTKYRIYPSEWCKESCTVSTTSASQERRVLLINIKEQIKLDVGRLKFIVATLTNQSTDFSADDIVAMYAEKCHAHTLFVFAQEVISRLRELNRDRCVETYTTTLNKFMRFRNGQDILLSDITFDLMMGYEAYLKRDGVTMNTISFYIRNLRAIYNRAVDQELIEQKHPFRKVYTGIEKTAKRALPLKNIKEIKETDLSLKPKMSFARDMFLLSFYTRGMSFVDMAFLRKKDLQNGVIQYRRRKTGQQLHIKWEKCMQDIVARYPPNETEYLLPIITKDVVNKRSYYQGELAKINTQLKKLSSLLSLQTPITMYVARHSWASVAKNRNIPLSVISEGMGHDSEATTQIYLASLDTAIVDKANRMILKLLA